MPSNVKLLAGASGGEPTDANFKNVTLLLHGDGSNGAQNNTFIDSSSNNFTITRNGNTTQGSFSPYGSNWSNYFDGSGDYLAMPSNAAFGLGSGDFTVECWVNPSSQGGHGSSDNDCIIDFRPGSGGGAYGTLYIASSGTSVNWYANTGVRITGGSIPNNSWTHLAISRVSGNTRLFINGVQSGSTYVDGTTYGTTDPWIGQFHDGIGSGYFNGYISNLRIVKGTGLYSSTFTPSTTPLTAITNTSLLTCAYNRFRDGSTNNFTITRNGDVKVTNFAPFAPSSSYSTTTNGGSAYFDNNGDYLAAPASSSLSLGLNNFTIEAWVYGSGAFSTDPIIESRSSGSSTGGYAFLVTSSGNLNVYTGGGFAGASSGTISPGAWNHVALVRTGIGANQVTYYINGVSSGTITLSSTLTDPLTNETKIGGSTTAGENWGGYISNLRVVNGTAVYTANFTPPSSPVTAITNTSLLLNATNAAIFDNSMKNDLETVGNAQISTSVKKFGTGSMYFDGNGDWLFSPTTPQFGFGTGDYTIEFWIYLPSLPSSKFSLFDFRPNYNDSVPHTMFINSSGYFGFFNGSSDVTASSQPISSGSWYHVAYSRGGGTMKIFVNGAQAYSGANTSDYLATRSITIGSAAGGLAGEYLNGYLDDIRITKGVARYTANFTPPTAPFPNK